MNDNVRERVEKQYYVYIFKSLKNERSRYYWHKNKHSEKEVPVESLEEYKNTMAYTEDAFDFTGYLVDGCSDLGIKNMYLFEAMMQLPEDDKDVVVLAYFFNFTDAEIGQIMNKKRSTIAYRRIRAIESIKNYMKLEEQTNGI